MKTEKEIEAYVFRNENRSTYDIGKDLYQLGAKDARDALAEYDAKRPDHSAELETVITELEDAATDRGAVRAVGDVAVGMSERIGKAKDKIRLLFKRNESGE